MDHFDHYGNRPFLVVYTIIKPAEGVNTSEKNWNRVTGNWKIFERIEIVDRIKKKHLSDASIILDLIKSKVVKSRFDKPDEEMMEHFYGKYMKECEKGIDIWSKKITPILKK